MQSPARPMQAGLVSRGLAWAHLIWKLYLIDKALRFDLQRCLRLTAAVGFTRALLGDAISSAGSEKSEAFQVGHPKSVLSFSSISPSPGFVLGRTAFPRRQETGESLLMSIGKVSDLDGGEPRRILGDKSFCSQGEECPPVRTGAACQTGINTNKYAIAAQYLPTSAPVR